MPLTIALDGPVGAGKSSVADEAARRLGILHLDTGAMYRAIGLYTLRQGIPLSEEEAVSALAEKVRVDVRYTGGAQHTLVAVSYTHLDVYKRQLLGHVLIGGLDALGLADGVQSQLHLHTCLLYTSRCV